MKKYTTNEIIDIFNNTNIDKIEYNDKGLDLIEIELCYNIFTERIKVYAIKQHKKQTIYFFNKEGEYIINEKSNKVFTFIDYFNEIVKGINKHKYKDAINIYTINELFYNKINNKIKQNFRIKKLERIIEQ